MPDTVQNLVVEGPGIRSDSWSVYISSLPLNLVFIIRVAVKIWSRQLRDELSQSLKSSQIVKSILLVCSRYQL